MNKVICIVGPTASGKTGLAIELAKKIDAEVISADSMQIYKDLDVGTAKVTKEEAQGIPHHMIDVCNVEDKFSVADAKGLMAKEVVDEYIVSNVHNSGNVHTVIVDYATGKIHVSFTKGDCAEDIPRFLEVGSY